jgi:3-hydroxyacyl-[acyl-carrier-protein] dehydratase
MLLNKLYTYEQVESELPSTLKFKVSINAGNEIFEGHFPGNPITPGVCQMEMVKEILSDHLSQDLFFNSISDMKFISMWEPKESELVFMDIAIKMTEDVYKINAKIYGESTVYFKLKGSANVCE